jgi:SpoVK/Ycf46/Vps4 family AAA+-type ATPase
LALDIVNIEYVGEEPTQCILVDNPSHLYLTDGFVVTHNTLTAEVYSEVMKRPLYKVQASQLGINIDKLEENLKEVLGRAEKWGAILLLDEADVYVHERGNDINQNAIVGVFLRVLEYYRGVLFMTTNRGTEIDDAIVSRLTARIVYQPPGAEERNKIWRILAFQNGIMLTDSDVAKLVKELPETTGRDIKNLLKLAKMVAEKKDGKVTAELIKRLNKFKQ